MSKKEKKERKPRFKSILVNGKLVTGVLTSDGDYIPMGRGKRKIKNRKKIE